MARWIWDNPEPKPRAAHTIIAGWWPGRYWLVTTIAHMGATGDSPLQKLTRSLPGSHPRDEYVVQVFKCGREGIATSWYEPWYERTFDDEQKALENHREVVRLIADGKLRLRRLRSDSDL